MKAGMYIGVELDSLSILFYLPLLDPGSEKEERADDMF